MTDLSIIIVTWNSAALIEKCLRLVLASRVSFSFEVLVFDNASSDNTIAVVEAFGDRVRIIPSSTNLGFGGGNNQAAQQADGRLLLLLNPDVFLRDDTTLQGLYDAMDSDSGVVALGPRLLNADLTHQVGDAGFEPRLRNIAAHMFLLNRFIGGVPALYVTGAGFLAQQRVAVDWISGACMLVRRADFLAVGGFSGQIFMYGEDVEIGLQLGKRGQLVYLPQLSVLHLQGGTQRADADDADTVHVSTKWIAHLFHYHAGPLPRTGLLALLLPGFTIRMAAYGLLGLVTGRAKFRAQAAAMGKYAGYTLTHYLQGDGP